MTVDMEHLLNAAIEAVRRGMNIALHPPVELDVHTKANRNDLVTAVDKAIEADIASHLHAVTGLPLLGEEGHTVDSWRGRVWVLDPIDGTLNYVAVHRHWAISLALVEDGAPVLGIVADPVDDRLYTAVAGRGARTGRLFDESGVGGRPLPLIQDATVADGVVIAHVHALACLGHLPEIVRSSRGLRCYGAAALELVEVAAGRAGSLVHPRLQPWDVAAGALICRETGAAVTRLDGTRVDVREPGSLVAGTPSAHAEMIERLVRG
mgnify:CR=1 FL=1